MKRVIDKSSVRFLEYYCLYSRNKNAVCTSCIDICPTKAIILEEGKITFDQNSCNDCNLCIHHCPTDALYLEKETLQQYEKKIITRDSVCFTCEKQEHSRDDIIIPCLSSLSPELVLIALMQKKSVQIFSEPAICQKCTLNYNVEKSISWLQEIDYIAYGDVHIINDSYEKSGKKRPITRRELFSLSKTKAKDEVGSLLLDSFDLKLTVKNKIPLPERRKYLAEFIIREKGERYLSIHLAEGLNLTRVKVDEECDLCGRCTQLCPTGALNLSDENDHLTLTYQAIQCINCEICSNNCSYIERSTETCLCRSVISPRKIKSSSVKSCPRCNGDIPNHLELCKDCFDIQKKQNELFSNW
ncbi:4Fe-4S dicluster domain-containing protein [Anaerobacillus isosaccharinicus]|uniref:4Fe-4S binding protein n=1 Tax=Anaerobacillus isosaccharinicus TaxID=1532552 RepID=A0A1S2LAP6_9BACI|nr:4Fe-4S dicluster domain-containing protein [Anaerobacillus isosaccharinicus]MBA5588183.1 4Fe-4S binding protein [Anaerobacillus isosaccharinicus]QOY38364.1 4Fe-4S binding protein [Anaerobacillus isosaccharinicus]